MVRVMRRSIRLLAALAVLATIVLPGLSISPSEAQVGPSVTVTPTDDIIDGAQLVVNVKTDAANTQPIYEARASVCRAGVTYQSGDMDLPSVEGRVGGPNCPPIPLSTSGQPIAVSSRTYKFAPTPEGENLYLRVGVGVVEWTDTTSGGTAQLTCDQNNPCVLLVQLLTDAGFEPFPVPLTFLPSDAISSCGGAAPGALSASGSDALADAWVRWTVASCSIEGQGAWSTMSFGEERQAVKRFAEGDLDLAYSALGYNGDSFLDGVASPRPVVPVPVGLGAATLGLANGYQDPDGRKVPFKSASLSLDEVTTLLAGGEFPFRDLGAQIAQRNPDLEGGNLIYNTATGLKVGAPAEAGSTPWILTHHFGSLRPGLWRVPDLPIFAEPGQARGFDVSFPLASPSYANVLTTMTGRPALAKALGGLGPNDLGGIWVFTDLTTAEAYGVNPAAIENVAGAFVAPTSETMEAAVPSMSKFDDGTRVPDPTASEGYPMTYVVYALAPAEPLTDASGACRTDSQGLLAKWLTYLVREGQHTLPAGMAPLTPELQAEAEAALQQVGQTPGAPCQVPPIASADGGVAPSATVEGTTYVPTSASAGTSSTASGGTASSSGSDAVEQANAALTVSKADEPRFFGGTLPSLLASLGR